MVEVEGKAPETPQAEPVVVRSSFGLNIRWPTSRAAWAGLAILVAADAWLVYTHQAEGVVVLTGYILTSLGLSAQQSTAISLAVAASAHANRAADVAEAAVTQTNEKLQLVQEAVKDIQDNPVQPGTPGWMDRNAPPP